MRVFIQTTDGKNNDTRDWPWSDLVTVIDWVRKNKGYYTEDKTERKVFVPYHRIDFIREEKD